MARRRARGSGSIYQDHDGQWWAKVPLGNGRTRRARCVDRKDAEATLKRLLAAKDDRIDLSASQQSLKSWLEKWLEAKEGNVAPRTWEFYKRHCEYMLPHIGHIKLEALEAQHVRGMLRQLKLAGLSPRSCEHVRCVLRNALGMALDDHLIRENVASIADPVRVEEYEAPVLEEWEIAALLGYVDAADERLGLMLHFALALGLRREELRTLRWADWDEKEHTITVRLSKTKAGRRTLPLTDDLERRLSALWDERQEERKLPHWKEHGYIFASEVGTPIGARNMNRWFDRIQKAAGLTRHIRLHDLRHTAISDWFAAGADPRGAQDLAGHASPLTTQRIYAKTRAGRLREVIEETERRRKRTG